MLPTLHQFLHPSPALQHCAKQVLCPGASEHLHLLTQSCLLWAESGVREQSLCSSTQRLAQREDPLSRCMAQGWLVLPASQNQPWLSPDCPPWLPYDRVIWSHVVPVCLQCGPLCSRPSS